MIRRRAMMASIPSIPTPQPVGEDKPVKYIDYDGTVVAQYTPQEFAALTTHPANPDHTSDGLLAQGWNWDLTEAKTYVADTGAHTIGQMYTTTDGKTRVTIDTSFWGRLDEISLYINQNKANGTEIDWGDGSAKERFAANGNASLSHTYALGVFTIEILPDDDCSIKIQSAGSYPSIFGYWSSSRVLNLLDGVTEVHIGARVTEVKYVGRLNLKIATIPQGVTVVQEFSRNGMNLKSITLPTGVTATASYLVQNGYSLESLSLPKGFLIGNSAFASCTSLQYASIPSGVTKITSSAFNTCPKIKNISIPNGITTIESNAFQNCYSLKTLNIPNSVTSIGNYAFQNCWSLETLTLPNSITEIPIEAFSNCNALKTLTLPNTLTTIGNSAFRHCYSLESITIPNSVTTIGNDIFGECLMARTIVIGTGVTSMGNNVFAINAANNTYIAYLESITIKATTPPTITSSTFNKTGTCPIYIPAGTLSAYQSATNWTALASRFVELSE